MSADNIAICPKCYAESRQKMEELTERLDAEYNAITLAEVRRRDQEIQSLHKASTETTLMENYEGGIDREGNFTATYYCRCDKCKWEWQFSGSDNVFMVENGKGTGSRTSPDSSSTG